MLLKVYCFTVVAQRDSEIGLKHSVNLRHKLSLTKTEIAKYFLLRSFFATKLCSNSIRVQIIDLHLVDCKPYFIQTNEDS